MRVAVLGAGLQGACVALELSVHGVEVDLYEKSDRCLSQTSSHNEGKMHLGYVYANDRSLRTARTMVRGSTVFQKLIGAGSATLLTPSQSLYRFIMSSTGKAFWMSQK